MTVTWTLFTILSLVCYTESKCSPTSYYKNCWIRRFPGLFIDIDESQRRGAQLLKFYQEETALKCSRTCCLTRNFSCNLAVFHYNTTQESVNCFHLHCPTLESCILRHRGNVILYNVTKGVDPDLLVFGKYFTSNVRVWPHLTSSRLNSSEPLASDKRQFNWPHVPLTSMPTERAPTTPQGTTQPPSIQTDPLPSVNTTLNTTAATVTSITSAPPTTTQTTSGHPSTPRKSTAAPKPTGPAPLPMPSTPPVGDNSSGTSLAAPANIEGSKPYPNDTKGYVSRNHTAGEGAGAGPGDGDLTPVWRLAANTLLVALATCATVLLGCCCSVLLAVSWRGRRRRKGHYRTAWRGKRGSMRLVKYVIVRESS